MNKAHIRFYEELNDSLQPSHRKREFEVLSSGKETVREIIEKLGAPAAQVDLLLVNGRSAGLDEIIHEGDRISVYPVFERLDIQGLSRVRDKPLRKLKFIVDRDLERLGPFLERLGLDVRHSDDLEEEEILRLAKVEQRILLTLQPRLMGSCGLDRVLVLRQGSPHEQVHKVTDALWLKI